MIGIFALIGSLRGWAKEILVVFTMILTLFIDTLLICSATGFMILLSGVLTPGSTLTGTPLTQAAMTVHLGSAGNTFVAVAIFFFAFTSIIGNYSYAENALSFLKLANKPGLTALRTAALVFVMWGSYESVATVFDAADAAMGLMATINLIAICMLSGLVVKLTNDYFKQLKTGEPSFDPAQYPELKGQIDEDIWNEALGSPRR